jgi:DNA-binding transcriptional LysR family regulator
VAVPDTARRQPVRTRGLQAGQPVLTVPDLAAKAEAQAAGLGVGYLPRHVAAPWCRAGRLVALALAEPPPPEAIYMAWRPPVRGRGLAWLLDVLERPEALAAALGGGSA